MHQARFFDCGFFDEFIRRIIIESAIGAIKRYGPKLYELLKRNPYLTLFVFGAVISFGMFTYSLTEPGLDYFLNYMTRSYDYIQNLSASGDPYARFWFNIYDTIGFNPISTSWASMVLSISAISWFVIGLAMSEFALRFCSYGQSRMDDFFEKA